AAHLAGQFGGRLAHLRLDQRMPGAPHQRAAAGVEDLPLQVTGALHVVDDDAAGLARQHIAREQHQQAVGVDDLARARDHAGSDGSGWWFGKLPSTSQYSGTTSQPTPSRTCGAMAPGMPLPASTTTFSERSASTSETIFSM